MKASTDTFKIIESIDDHTGGNNRPVLIVPGSRRKQCPLPPPPPARLSRGGGNPWVDGSSYLDRAGSDRCIKGWSRRTMQSPQCKPIDSTRIGTGQSRFRGRVRCLNHLIAWQRRRREPGSNSVIVTASLTRCEGHVEGRGGLQRVRKIFAGCPAILSFWDQSPALSMRGFETVGNRLYPLHGQNSLCRFAAEAKIQDRSRAKTGLNTAPAFPRVPRRSRALPRLSRAGGNPEKNKAHRLTSPLPRWERARVRVTPRGDAHPQPHPTSFPRNHPSFLRTPPVPRYGGGNPEKNNARRPHPLSLGERGASKRSPKDRHESGVCPGQGKVNRGQTGRAGHLRNPRPSV